MDRGLLLFSPDATTTGKYLQALERIEAEGLRVEHAVWARMTDPQVAALYAENRIRRGLTAKDEAVNRLFRLDYSLVCLVDWMVAPAGSTVTERLLSIKGPSRPELYRTNHLRWQLGAENSILNFLHTSDSAVAAEAEARIFFPDGLETMGPFSHCRPWPAPPTDLMRRRSITILGLVADLKRALLEVEGSVAPWYRCLAEEATLSHQVRRSPGAVARLAEIYAAEKDLPRKGIPPRSAQALEVLEVLEPEHPDPFLIREALKTAGLGLDPWQALILNCWGT